MKNSIESMPWGTFDGEEVRLWRLVNANGLELQFTNFGGRLIKAIVPDRNGHFENVTLGWPTLDEYVAENGGTYYGALVGSRSTARSTHSSSTTSRPASPARCTAASAASRSATGPSSRRSTTRTRWASFWKSSLLTARAATPATLQFVPRSS